MNYVIDLYVDDQGVKILLTHYAIIYHFLYYQIVENPNYIVHIVRFCMVIVNVGILCSLKHTSCHFLIKDIIYFHLRIYKILVYFKTVFLIIRI